jgi:hypothetical protein
MPDSIGPYAIVLTRAREAHEAGVQAFTRADGDRLLGVARA